MPRGGPRHETASEKASDGWGRARPRKLGAKVWRCARIRRTTRELSGSIRKSKTCDRGNRGRMIMWHRTPGRYDLTATSRARLAEYRHRTATLMRSHSDSKENTWENADAGAARNAKASRATNVKRVNWAHSQASLGRNGTGSGSSIGGIDAAARHGCDECSCATSRDGLINVVKSQSEHFAWTFQTIKFVDLAW